MRALFGPTIRLLLLLAFIASMPILSIPRVNQWVDEHLFAVPVLDADRMAPKKSIQEVEITTELPEEPKARRGAEQFSARPASRDLTLQFAAQNAAIEEQPPAPSESEVEVDPASFERFQKRFQQLGVEYLVLEKLAGDSSKYRFHCRMAVPGSSAYARPFEAHDADPHRAMQHVLTEVERWCASHSTTTSSKLR